MSNIDIYENASRIGSLEARIRDLRRTLELIAALYEETAATPDALNKALFQASKAALAALLEGDK